MGSVIVRYILEGVMTLLLTLDGIIYNFISWFYEIFMFLAKLNLFSNEDYESIVRRIYIILGIIMLFVLSYSLLKAIINPDEYAKGEKSFVNIVKNVLISLVIIVVLPTIFDVAFRVQTVIINYDVIGRIILNENVGRGAIDNGGRTISTNVFRAFFAVNPDAQTGDYASDYNSIRAAVASAFDEVANRDASFLLFAGKYKGFDFPELVVGKAISYTFLISHIAGLFVLWCILLFCFDLGIRVIKLIYFQMIAPIAVACRVIPGNKAKEIFPNWVKKTVSTFLEVFIRIFIMYMGVYLITLLVDKFPDVAAAGDNAGLGNMQRLLVKAFLIMGIVAFIRQAPKLIQDVFGFETGGINLGLKGLTERLSNGGGFAAGALIGATTTGLARNITHGIRNIATAPKGKRVGQAFKEVLKAPGGVFRSVTAGVNGAYSAINAKNFSEAKDATGKAVKKMTDRRDRKESYWARYNGNPIKVAGGRVADVGRDFLSWAGWSNIEILQNENKQIADLLDSMGAAEDIIRKKIQSDIAQGKKTSYSTAGRSADAIKLDRDALEADARSGRVTGAQYAARVAALNAEENAIVEDVLRRVTQSASAFDSENAEFRGTFADARISHTEFRKKARNMAAKPFFAEAHVSGDMLDDNKSIDLGSRAFKDLKQQGKIAQANNAQKIQNLREHEDAKNSTK